MKFLAFIFLLCSISSFLYSKENEEVEYDYKKIRGISVGGGGFFELSKAGGFGEFGFNLYAKKSFDIRNYIRVGGSASLNRFLFFMITERVVFGAVKAIRKDFAIRRYALLELSFLLFQKESKRFNHSPYIFDLKIGSGIEFIIGRGSYFIETTVGYSFITKGTIRSALDVSPVGGAISLGGRRYF